MAVVDDPTIHELNRRFLAHDYPTDVLSFVLEESAEALEGEIIVSTTQPRHVPPATDGLPSTSCCCM